MHRAGQFSQLFLGCIFTVRPAQMEMEKPQAWFHWWFLFLVNLAALLEQPKLILKWMLIGRWRRPSMLSSMCQHVARLQFDSCEEKHSLCGTVMIHDGLNLTCLDQCHGVRSYGKSSSQSWRKRSVVQSRFDPWVYILGFAEGDLCCLPLAKRFCAKGYEENDKTMTMAP